MKFVVSPTVDGKQYLVCEQDPQDPTVRRVVYGYAFDRQLDAERWAVVLGDMYAKGHGTGFRVGYTEGYDAGWDEANEKDDE